MNTNLQHQFLRAKVFLVQVLPRSIWLFISMQGNGMPCHQWYATFQSCCKSHRGIWLALSAALPKPLVRTVPLPLWMSGPEAQGHFLESRADCCKRLAPKLQAPWCGKVCRNTIIDIETYWCIFNFWISYSTVWSPEATSIIHWFHHMV